LCKKPAIVIRNGMQAATIISPWQWRDPPMHNPIEQHVSVQHINKLINNSVLVCVRACGDV